MEILRCLCAETDPHPEIPSILEIITLSGLSGIAVHALDIEQGAEFFPRLHADIPEIISPVLRPKRLIWLGATKYHFSRHVVGTADETKTILHDLQNAACHLRCRALY